MTISITPARSHAQRLAALKEANRVRCYRAALKKRITAGELTILDVRDDPDMQTARVVEFLLVEPQIGKQKANRIIRAANVSPSKTFGGITDRQWLALQAAFMAHPIGAKLTINREALAA